MAMQEYQVNGLSPQGAEQRATRPTVLGQTETGTTLVDDDVEVSRELKGWGYSDKKLAQVFLSRRDPQEDALAPGSLTDSVDQRSFTDGWGMESGLADPEAIRIARMEVDDRARRRRATLRERRLEADSKRRRASLKGINLLVPLNVLAPTPDEVLSEPEREKARRASKLDKLTGRPSIDERKEIDYHLQESGLVDDLFVYGEPISRRAHLIAVEGQIDLVDEADQKIPTFNEVYDAEEHARIQEAWAEAEEYRSDNLSEYLGERTYAPTAVRIIDVAVLGKTNGNSRSNGKEPTDVYDFKKAVVSLELIAGRELAAGIEQDLAYEAFESALAAADRNS